MISRSSSCNKSLMLLNTPAFPVSLSYNVSSSFESPAYSTPSMSYCKPFPESFHHLIFMWPVSDLLNTLCLAVLGAATWSALFIEHPYHQGLC